MAKMEIQKGYKYKFSIVMAVCNTEPFLRESVSSILSQDIGFSENVQLILVDDESTDGSGDICDQFSELYPENIVVIHKRHGGVSAARNAGLRCVEGEFVNCMDSDDKLSLDALRKVYAFFKEHDGEIDCVAIPDRFFDGARGEHPLNYKFEKGSRVIDLTKEIDVFHNAVRSFFITREQAEKVQFDVRMDFSEDFKVCLQVLIEKCKLGVVADTCYWYRKRTFGEQSALQTIGTGRRPSYYIPCMRYLFAEVADYAQERLGEIPLFVQSAFLYDLNWKMSIPMKVTRQVLNENEIQEYLSLVYGIIKCLDDKILLKHRSHGIYWQEHQTFLLSKKYEESPCFLKEGKELVVTVCGNRIIGLSKCKCILDFLRIKEDIIEIEGHATFLGLSDTSEVEISLCVNEEFDVPCQSEYVDLLKKECLGEDILPAYVFKGVISNCNQYDKLTISIQTSVDGMKVERTNIRVGKFFPIGQEFRESYCAKNGWIARLQKSKILIEKADEGDVIAQEGKFLKELEGLNRDEARQAVQYRTLYHLLKPRCQKEIWVVSDRINKADDNGEALFRFLNEHDIPEQVFFVIQRESDDYERLKQYGNVLDYLSFDHKLIHLLADKYVSSLAEEYVSNPFGGGRKYFRDILWKKPIVFLQHGIIKDDLSEWLLRYNQNLSMFVTSSPFEYQSILDGKYHYDEKCVKLTGLPRYDYLENREKKIVTIMPTWRASLGSSISMVDGSRNYDDTFKKTGFYLFYDALLNHHSLLAAAKKYGYRIQFMPHPNLMGAVSMFHKNEIVEFCSIQTRYQDIFAETSLLVTDYSSVAFDCAYLQKPVMYCQFDKDEFFKQQIYDQGYFDYEKNGLGEVTYDLDDTVKCIVDYMKNGCQMKEVYRKRGEEFYAFHDKGNCRRVYEAVKAISVDKELLSIVFPRYLFKCNEKIVICGDKELTRRYCLENNKTEYVKIVGVIEEVNDNIKRLKMMEFDGVLIAVENGVVARDIRNKLMGIGVPQNCIKWDNFRCRGGNCDW